jgi:hypothetical protein
MKKILFFELSITILFVLYGCSTPRIPPAPRKIPIVTEKIIEKNFETIWSKLIDYFGAKNIPIKTIDKASGILSTEYDLRTGKNGTSYDCDCGTIGTDYSISNKYENYKGNFNVIVSKINDNQTKVKINAFFYANYNSYHYEGERYIHKLVLVNSLKVKCESTGFIENEIFVFIQ